eukprot:TRINITY_DN5473_c0_g1_i1.p1 TRINITY_DN5473_c0_g1~~TRINITY_DN5473_c0_g1_i1.p1  ORF type:complete len:350 (-),score=27.27 TRINITY_DN5473_c0_g1_i1:466-1515(-)
MNKCLSIPFLHPKVQKMGKQCNMFRKYCEMLAAVLVASSINGVLSQSRLCRRSCGDLQIKYPFGIDDGCGTVEYRSRLVCTREKKLQLRTPTGTYQVKNISYERGPHMIISDSSMWSCSAGGSLPESQIFRLDASTKFSISVLNNFLFFNCNESFVMVQTQPTYCQSQPTRCASICDNGNRLCLNLPACPRSLPAHVSCCSYFPRTSDSIRLMLQYCKSYTSIFWDISQASGTTYGVPSYGIRLNFEVPVTSRCRQCQDKRLGGGTCGFETDSGNFTCLCSGGNSSTFCTDRGHFKHESHPRATAIAGTVIGLTVVAMVAAGAVFWYRRRKRVDQPVKLAVVNSRAETK